MSTLSDLTVSTNPLLTMRLNNTQHVEKKKYSKWRSPTCVMTDAPTSLRGERECMGKLAAAHGVHHVLPTIILRQGRAITFDNHSVVSVRFAFLSLYGT